MAGRADQDDGAPLTFGEGVATAAATRYNDGSVGQPAPSGGGTPGPAIQMVWIVGPLHLERLYPCVGEAQNSRDTAPCVVTAIFNRFR